MSLLGNPTDPKRRIKYGSRNEGASIAPPGAAIEQQAEKMTLFVKFPYSLCSGTAAARANAPTGKTANFIHVITVYAKLSPIRCAFSTAVLNGARLAMQLIP